MLRAANGAVLGAVSLLRGAVPASWSARVPSTARWGEERSRAWQQDAGWLVGCNFMPPTAGNQLEMWQGDTFDPPTIDRELGWAKGLGFNSVRVFLLHDLLWRIDGDRFLARVDAFLSIASSHDISTMLVLFDGVWDPSRIPGPKGGRVRVSNSIWVQSPGSAILADPAHWGALRTYLEAVMQRFRSDHRVIAWDLFNEPDNLNVTSYPRKELPHKQRLVTDLVDAVFDWSQSVDPVQPMTAGVFLGVGGATERVSRLNRIMLSRSDVISFHCYGGRRSLAAAIDHLSAYHRPLVCTEWLARPRSPVELLELMAEKGVGAYSWGLVDGKTRTAFSVVVVDVANAKRAGLASRPLAQGRQSVHTAEATLIGRVCKEQPEQNGQAGQVFELLPCPGAAVPRPTRRHGLRPPAGQRVAAGEDHAIVDLLLVDARRNIWNGGCRAPTLSSDPCAGATRATVPGSAGGGFALSRTARPGSTPSLGGCTRPLVDMT